MKTQTYVSRPNTPTQIPVEYYPPFSPSPPPSSSQQFWLGQRETEARLGTSCSRSQPELLAAESEEPLAPRVQQLTRGRKKNNNNKTRNQSGVTSATYQSKLFSLTKGKRSIIQNSIRHWADPTRVQCCNNFPSNLLPRKYCRSQDRKSLT